MKFLSLHTVTDEVFRTINNHPLGSLIGVIGNQFCGFKYFTRVLKEEIENLQASRCIIVPAECLTNPIEFRNYLNTLLETEFGETDSSNLESSDLSGAMQKFINKFSEQNIKTLLLIIENFGSLDLSQQYQIGSQFRNVREIAKFNDYSTGLHTILLGEFSFFSIESYCNNQGTSSFLDEFYFIEKSTHEEISTNQFLNNDLKLAASYDYCNGVWELVEKFYLELSKGGTEEKVIKSIIFDNRFITPIKEKIDILNKEHLTIIEKLLNGFKVITVFNKETEDLYLSGLISVEIARNKYSLHIRNWLFENVLRNLLSNNIFTQSSEVIAPIYSNNLLAYKIIMRIENRLKNILLFALSKCEYTEHPLQVLDIMGGVKTIESSGKKITYFEWCKYKSRQLKENFSINTQNTLISFLDIKDIKDILLSNAHIGNNIPVSELFKEYWLNPVELDTLLEKLRRIRNPIAHNNIIDISIVEILEDLEKNIFNSLTKKAK